MSAYRIVVSKKTYSKTNVGDYVKVGKDDSGVTLYCKVFSKECHPSNTSRATSSSQLNEAQTISSITHHEPRER